MGGDGTVVFTVRMCPRLAHVTPRLELSPGGKGAAPTGHAKRFPSIFMSDIMVALLVHVTERRLIGCNMVR